VIAYLVIFVGLGLTLPFLVFGLVVLWFLWETRGQ
jgi:hypothetical protein